VAFLPELLPNKGFVSPVSLKITPKIKEWERNRAGEKNKLINKSKTTSKKINFAMPIVNYYFAIFWRFY